MCVCGDLGEVGLRDDFWEMRFLKDEDCLGFWEREERMCSDFCNKRLEGYIYGVFSEGKKEGGVRDHFLEIEKEVV